MRPDFLHQSNRIFWRATRAEDSKARAGPQQGPGGSETKSVEDDVGGSCDDGSASLLSESESEGESVAKRGVTPALVGQNKSKRVEKEETSARKSEIEPSRDRQKGDRVANRTSQVVNPTGIEGVTGPQRTKESPEADSTPDGRVETEPLKGRSAILKEKTEAMLESIKQYGS